MTQHPSDAEPEPQLQDIQSQLPWYVNETLSDAEREAVERHLSRSPDLQADAAQWQQLADAIRALEVEREAPSPDQFAALMARIDADEAANSLAQSEPTQSGWPVRSSKTTLRSKLASFWQEVSVAARFALAVQGAVVILLAGVIVWQTRPASNAVYTTLSRQETTQSAHRGRIRLMFSDETTVKEMRALLTNVQATIVAGPSPIGLYTIEIPLATDTGHALSIVVQTLRGHPAVQLAEPISTP